MSYLYEASTDAEDFNFEFKYSVSECIDREDIYTAGIVLSHRDNISN